MCKVFHGWNSQFWVIHIGTKICIVGKKGRREKDKVISAGARKKGSPGKMGKGDEINCSCHAPLSFNSNMSSLTTMPTHHLAFLFAFLSPLPGPNLKQPRCEIQETVTPTPD